MADQNQSASIAAAAPMFGPDGAIHLVPNEQIPEAMKNQGELAVPMRDPSGTMRYVRASQVKDAIAANGKVDFSGVPQAQHEGLAHALFSDLGGMAKAVATSLPASMDAARSPVSAMETGAQIGLEDYERQQEGRSPAYRVVAPVATIAGVNSRGMEEAANRGDTGGVVGHAAAPFVAAAVAKGVGEAAPALRAKISDVPEAYNSYRTAAQKAVMPNEIGNLPPKAVVGVEQLFRSSAPTGTKIPFRSNLYAAAGDLAEIGRRINLQEARGGIIRPDMRVRATVNALNDYMTDMYQTERLPQIERNAQAPVKLSLGEDAASGLDYLARNAGHAADRALAAKAIDEGVVPLSDVDQLARLTNKELLDYEEGTASQRSTAEATSKNIAGLKELDRSLGNTLDEQLTARGETGIRSYERRMAALSQFRNQLAARMNAAELNQPGLIKGVGDKVVRPVTAAFTGGPSGIASASQAAVADVNIGRALQQGFKQLADSGLQPQRSGAMPTMRVAGALPPSRMMPASSIPVGPEVGPQYVAPTTTAERLGRLLPETTGGPHVLEYQPEMSPGELKAAIDYMLRNRRMPPALPQKTAPILLPPSSQ